MTLPILLYDILLFLMTTVIYGGALYLSINLALFIVLLAHIQ